MTDFNDPGRDSSHRAEDGSSRSVVSISRQEAPIVRSSTMESMEVLGQEDGSPDVVAPRHTEADVAPGEGERVLGTQDDARPAASGLVVQTFDLGWSGVAIRASVVALPATVPSKVRGDLVRERMNAAARPILESFARRRGMPLERLQEAIDGPRPLTHPEIVRRLGGALHSGEMQGMIASQADPALLPLKVRAGVANMAAQDLSGPPPAAAREAFPDWNKPLAPLGHQLQPWRPKEAAVWLKRFPPNEGLLHPMDGWDSATAALWLNDREAIPSGLPRETEFDGKVVAFEPPGGWAPPLEVLYALDELELEALAYRVFVERLRREVMPFYVSERRIQVRKAVELVTFGYQTLEEARRSVRTYDRWWIAYFDRVFGKNREWIYDLCCRIIAAYAWPDGFAEPDIWVDYPGLDDALR